ncbi:MAG: CopG family transcriptional regulator [Thermoguttaceae bacterium]|jgi:hypothetical protein
MHRTTIMLPPELKAEASRRAQRMGVSLGELIRESLTAWLGKPGKSRTEDPLFDDDAVFDGPVPADGSANHDYYLYGEGRDLR